MSQASSSPSPPSTRPGPRPLGLHLNSALTILQGSLAALPSSRLGLIAWSASVRDQARSLAAELARSPDDAVARALVAEVGHRFRAMLDGIRLYRSHPYVRDLAPMPAVWSAGGVRLVDYGGDGPPVLFVPSLVNRGYVLDLSAQRSLLRWLGTQGFHPYLVGWGSPTAAERPLDLGGYVLQRLVPALDHLTARHGGAVPVVGYCMGGDLALALALARSDAVSALALLATPWDFHAEGGAGRGRLLVAGRDGIEASLKLAGEMPVDALQAFFLGLDPSLSLKKFAAFAAMDQASQGAADFVALEDWLNDGVPLVPAVARDCLIGWYGENATARLGWQVDGEVVDPARLACPLLLAVPANDRIVPPGSARAAGTRAASGGVAVTEIAPPLGHIGMVVGSRAAAQLWQPLADWLRPHAAVQNPPLSMTPAGRYRGGGRLQSKNKRPKRPPRTAKQEFTT